MVCVWSAKGCARATSSSSTGCSVFVPEPWSRRCVWAWRTTGADPGHRRPPQRENQYLEGMQYMFSQATADGVMTLTITFGLGTDLDKAQVQVQNRVAQALPRLPQEVQRLGVTTEKTSPDLLMVVHLLSPDNRYDTLYLANLAVLQVKDELNRIPGVGNVQIFGAGDFSMRIWLNPNQLAAHNLTATDVVKAIREQNVQVAAGVLGAPPTNT